MDVANAALKIDRTFLFDMSCLLEFHELTSPRLRDAAVARFQATPALRENAYATDSQNCQGARFGQDGIATLY
jgi:hypothetical protein